MTTTCSPTRGECLAIGELFLTRCATRECLSISERSSKPLPLPHKSPLSGVRSVRYAQRLHGIVEDGMRLMRCHSDIDLSRSTAIAASSFRAQR
jgi:hypothetical protein